ncbi:MAG TPA: hypothetical protein VFK18_01065, partial [Luteimonas sp.]|nr:hypothetical protein [Luteimonas sp.]
MYEIRYRTAQEWLDFFRRNFGPTRQTFERLDKAAGEAFAADLIALAGRFNRSGEATLVVDAEYLEAVITV